MIKKHILYTFFFIVFFSPEKVLSSDFSSVNVSAVVLSKNTCRFNSNNVVLNFGTINGGVSSDVTATATVTFRCGGSSPLASYIITDDDGLYESGPGQKRMRNQTIITEFLPYTMNYNPQMGTIPRNTNTTLTITATISSNDIGNAISGTYTDTVILSIVP